MKKIIFVSHNYFGAACLREILKILHENPKEELGKVECIITRKYDPSISDYSREFSEIANEHGIKLIETDNINKLIDEIKAISPDFIFVFGWSQIISKEILSIPKEGVLGTHPSILPKNRGSAAIPWQILNNEKISGVTLFFLEESVDSGDIVAQEVFELSENETASTLYKKVINAGITIIRKHLKCILKGDYMRIPQNHNIATFLGKRDPSDGLINWYWDGEYICRFIRAVGEPYPGAYTYLKCQKGYKKIIIKEVEPYRYNNYCGVVGSVVGKIEDGVIVQTGKGLIKIRRIYVEGEGEFKAQDYLKWGNKFGINYADEIIQLIDEIKKLKEDLDKMKKINGKILKGK